MCHGVFPFLSLGASDTEAVRLATKGWNPEMWVQTQSCNALFPQPCVPAAWTSGLINGSLGGSDMIQSRCSLDTDYTEQHVKPFLSSLSLHLLPSRKMASFAESTGRTGRAESARPFGARQGRRGRGPEDKHQRASGVGGAKSQTGKGGVSLPRGAPQRGVDWQGLGGVTAGELCRG